uniref:Uncharacterized protein n=1 Tax=Arion vulgaris TaxID=1028688 RepID=A0A0B6Z5D4_9EUPU
MRMWEELLAKWIDISLLVMRMWEKLLAKWIDINLSVMIMWVQTYIITFFCFIIIDKIKTQPS